MKSIPITNLISSVPVELLKLIKLIEYEYTMSFLIGLNGAVRFSNTNVSFDNY